MTDIELVRTLISDSLQYGVAQAVGDAITTEYLLPNATVYPDSETVRTDGTIRTSPSEYTIDESLGLITFVSAPANGADIEITFKYSLLSDDQIEAIMGQYENNPIKLGAADCLDAIAVSEALIQKRIKSLDLQTDGPAVADSLRKAADSLRTQVANNLEEFDIAETVYDRQSKAEWLIKNFIKES